LREVTDDGDDVPEVVLELSSSEGDAALEAICKIRLVEDRDAGLILPFESKRVCGALGGCGRLACPL
jgi:hypothetical protein